MIWPKLENGAVTISPAQLAYMLEGIDWRPPQKTYRPQVAAVLTGCLLRNRPLKVLVSERERAEIETRAAATGLSVSAYLRYLGLGFQPNPTLDQEAILALLKVNADQGRLGGLFKLRLSGQGVPSAESMEIRKHLSAIEECQLKLTALRPFLGLS